MKCYNHPSTDAVGLCCLCHKGLCKNCCQEESSYLVCSKACAQNLKEKEEINDRAKKIYGIGPYKKKDRIPLLSLFFMSLGVVFGGLGVYNLFHYYNYYDFSNNYLIVVGLVFIIFGIIYWRRAKKLGLNL
jgi:hypothetical protein